MIIYNIVNPIDGAVLYVGKTVNFQFRKYQHLNNSHNACLRSIIGVIKLNGREPIFNILEECNEYESSKAELKWINHFKKLGFSLCNVNITDRNRIIAPHPSGLHALPVYLPKTKYDKFKSICTQKRIPMSRMGEILVDKIIKRDYA